ncbi:hypothetical protein HU200_041227 [Digitaria exilis]|uniref:Major facilitator superfamily (MFS) profile domain-containing protein n=1 Tax=Digitaria exilis TaxID=1010633 RepID=A0A835EH85_9POAL|nr:hypothetical protein HU200_041227 [Digitaria exilis]
MEGGIHKAESTEFRDLLYLTSKQPFILRLAFSAGIGGILFGYDTGVISGALLYIRDDFEQVEKSTLLQHGGGGRDRGRGHGRVDEDRSGRRPSILIADLLFLAGSLVMCFAPAPAIIIAGRVLVGLGVGMASMTSPLYISEASPARIRGALVSTNGLLITAGQFLSYLINLAFTKVTGTWRWMLGVAGLPALVQFVLMLALPESPCWLYRKNRKAEAEEVMRKVYPPEEVDAEIEALRASVEADVARQQDATLRKALGIVVVRRGLTAGVLCQVAQQLVGINTVMYYSPTIVQLAGFASNTTALALSLVTSGLNAAGSVVSMFFVDKAGRRRLMLLSLAGIVACLALLSGVFFAVDAHSPDVSLAGTAALSSSLSGVNATATATATATCPEFALASGILGCGFCSDAGDKLLPGACLAASDASRRACRNAGGEGGRRREWYARGCPSSFGWLALVALGAYIVSYSPGMGSVPWLINSEVYPLRFRGVCGGIAAVANWASNLLVTQTFLSLTQALGTAGTFMLFCGVSAASFLLLFLLVPETKGLQFEEVEQILGSDDYRAWKKFDPKA